MFWAKKTEIKGRKFLDGELLVGQQSITPKSPFLIDAEFDKVRGKVFFPAVILTVYGDISLEVYPPRSDPEEKKLMKGSSDYPVEIYSFIKNGFSSILHASDISELKQIDGSPNDRYLIIRSIHGNVDLTLRDPDTYIAFANSMHGRVSKNNPAYTKDSAKRGIGIETTHGDINISYLK